MTFFWGEGAGVGELFCIKRCSVVLKRVPRKYNQVAHKHLSLHLVSPSMLGISIWQIHSHYLNLLYEARVWYGVPLMFVGDTFIRRKTNFKVIHTVGMFIDITLVRNCSTAKNVYFYKHNRRNWIRSTSSSVRDISGSRDISCHCYNR